MINLYNWLGLENPSQSTLDGVHALPLINEIRREGDKVRLFTEDPASVLETVMEYLKVKNVKPLSVNTLGPSLEDVFIKLTGLDASVKRGQDRG